jgi:acetyl esterase/lipase
MKFYLLISCCLLAVISCKKKEAEPPPPAPLAEQISFNVAYGSDPYQKMDIYLPANRTTTTTKILVAIHGGAWALGDKADNNFLVDSLRKRLPNFAVFNINYRLAASGNNLYPAANNDINAAINFILSKTGSYVTSDKVCLLGLSAGGHLGLLEAYKNNSAGKIKAVVSAFGPTDLTDMWNNPAGTATTTRFGLANYLGTFQPVSPATYTAASPVTYAVAGVAPTQLFHGTADTVVSINQSVLLRNKLQTLGVPVQYTSYTGEGHGWLGANLTDTFNKIAAFLLQYLP